MSTLADYIRPFWIKGINEVNKNVKKTLQGWILDKDFQVYSQIEASSAILNVSNEHPLVESFAADCTRMAIAAFESIEGITQYNKLPRSSAWFLIRLYYSAFFSAHAILKMLGISITQLDNSQTNAIEAIADLYGNQNGRSLSKGLYLLKYDSITKSLTLIKTDSADGSHGVLWNIFYEEIRNITSSILSTQSSLVVTQRVAAKLYDLSEALSNQSSLNGTWLSNIRNRINYRHEFGVWFPYENRVDYLDYVFSMKELWKQDPLNINIWSRGRDIQKFIEAASLVISICRVMCDDMSNRCSHGQSFHTYGCLNLLNHLQS